MPLTLAFLKDDLLIRADLHGRFSFDRTWNAIQAVKCEVAAHPVDGVLIDLRGLDYTPSMKEVAQFADELIAFLGRRRLALVTRTVVQFGMASLIVMHADHFDAEVSVFLCDDDALQWLQRPDRLTRPPRGYPRLAPRKLD